MAKRVPRPRATGYPSDVSEDEWSFVAPYLTLSRLDRPQRTHDLRVLLRVHAGRKWPTPAPSPSK